jgi:hypothetical protein
MRSTAAARPCAWLEAHRLPHVLAVRCTEPLQPTAGAPTPAAGLAEAVPPERWLTINAGMAPRAAAGMPGRG